MSEIFTLNCYTRVDDDLYQKFLKAVSSHRRQRVKKFIKQEDGYRSLLSELLIRYIATAYYKIQNESLIFLTNKFGKPYLKDIPGFHFNISHSGQWIVCAVDSAPLGVDIQEIREIDFQIANRYFHQLEYDYLIKQNKSDKLDCFYQLWVLKESYIKAVGKGLSIPLDSFYVTIENDSINLYTPYEKGKYYCKMYHIEKNYKLALCLTAKEFPERVKIVNIHELLL